MNSRIFAAGGQSSKYLYAAPKNRSFQELHNLEDASAATDMNSKWTQSIIVNEEEATVPTFQGINVDLSFHVQGDTKINARAALHANVRGDRQQLPEGSEREGERWKRKTKCGFSCVAFKHLFSHLGFSVI